MKKIMFVSNRKVQKQVPVTPGKVVDVFLKNNLSEKVLSRFVVQSVAKTSVPGVVLLVLTKSDATLLVEWNVENAEVKLNYVNGLVQREDFLRMDVVKGRESFAVTRELTYLDQISEAVKEPLTPGSTLSSHNAEYVVEYITQDGSYVLQASRKSKSGATPGALHPAQAILIGPKNQEFWKSLHEKIEVVAE